MSDYSTNDTNTGLWIFVIAAAGVAFLSVLYLILTGGAPENIPSSVLTDPAVPTVAE